MKTVMTVGLQFVGLMALIMLVMVCIGILFGSDKECHVVDVTETRNVRVTVEVCE